MDLLILGGTVFLGRHLARVALARGHRVTLFHRGRHALDPAELLHDAGALSRLDTLQGDRREGFASLKGRRWDAVIDTSGYTPSEIVDAVKVLEGSVGHYTFVSSLSAYSDPSIVGISEDHATSQLSGADLTEAESLDRENPEQAARFYEFYGPLKAACERELLERLPAKGLVVRPGLIVGPYDPTDRFTYWPERAARGGVALAPGDPERAVQFIDARDLAEWMIELAEQRRTGAFNANGPTSPTDMGTVLESCARIAAAGTRYEWCDEAFLLEAGVAPWMGLPLWIPRSDAAMAGFMTFDCSRARAAGLTSRPLDDTVRDTLEWTLARSAGGARRAGLDAAREADLLEQWRAKRAAIAGDSTPR